MKIYSYLSIGFGQLVGVSSGADSMLSTIAVLKAVGVDLAERFAVAI